MTRKLLYLFVALVILVCLALIPVPANATDGEVQDISLVELPGKGHARLDSHLNQLVSAATRGEASSFARQSDIKLVDDKVRVIVEYEPGKAEAATGATGALGTVESRYRDWQQVVVPISRLTALADVAGVHLVRLPWPYILDVVSEGVPLINADDWHSAGYTGAGVKVAILDSGFTGYSALLGTELPASVTTQSFQASSGYNIAGSTSHGTACAEIVYDVAPDAQLYLVNFGTTVELGNAVDWLIAQGVNIISFSMGNPIGGPGDGTGPNGEIVDRARAAGILWSSSIGNSAQRHWQGDFVDTYDGDGLHEFSQNPLDEGNTISVSQGYTITTAMRWDDPWGASANDYDLYLLDNASNIVYGSTSVQDGNDNPNEGFSYVATYTGTYGIAIYKRNATRDVNFHLYSYYHNLEYQTASSSFAMPADSPNVMTVGAVPYNNPTTLEPFSSQGPTDDGRVKPDLVAPDGVSSATYGASAFYGTSASAPNAAGAAALVKQHFPSYGPAEIQSFLESRAVDLGAAGKDNLYGSGRLFLGYPKLAVTTLSASNVTAYSAVLNGNLDSPGDYGSANVSFEWGTASGNLTQATSPRTMTSTGNLTAMLTGLSPNTKYYYRAKATSGSITVRGDELSFTTNPMPVWSVLMTAVTASEGSNLNLAFGTNTTATDNFDQNLDIPHPPPGQGAKMDAYFEISDSLFPQLDRDFRAPANSIQWTLKVSSTGTENITLSWDGSNIPSELSASLNTGSSLINMKAQNNVILPAGNYTINISVSNEVAVEIALKAGWNMVSVPVTPSNTAVNSVFPTALVVYGWNPATKSYSPVTNVEAGKGYWVAVMADTVVTITGVSVPSWTINISAGWNMIGSVISSAGFTQPEDNPDASVQAFVYWWNPTTKSYLLGTTIEPGKGYWAASVRGCTLTLSTASK